MSYPFTLIAGSKLGQSYSSLTQLGDIQPGESFGQANLMSYINVANGNAIIEDPLCKVVEAGVFLPLQWVYNSQVAAAGLAWRFSANKQLKQLSDDTVVMTEPDGHETIYRKKNGIYYAPGHGVGTPRLQFLDSSSKESWVWRDPKSNATEYFDAEGKRMSHSDREGQTTHFSYQDNSMTITGASGIRYELQYEGDRFTLYMVAGESRQLLRRYHLNEQGLLKQTEFPSGYRIDYEYENNSQLLSKIKQSDGTEIDFFFDKSQPNDTPSKLTAIRFGGDLGYNFDYTNPLKPMCTDISTKLELTLDDSGHLLQKDIHHGYGEALVDTTRYEYTTGDHADSGQLKLITHVDGGVERFSYHPDNGLIAEHQRQDGQLTQHYYGDGPDHMDLKVTQVQTVDGQQLVTRYVYNHFFNQNSEREFFFLRFTISPSGRVTEFQPDSVGNIAKKLVYLEDVFQFEFPNHRPPPLSDLEAWVEERRAQNAPVSVTDYHYNNRNQNYRMLEYANTDGTTGHGVIDASTQDTWQIQNYDNTVINNRMLITGVVGNRATHETKKSNDIQFLDELVDHQSLVEFATQTHDEDPAQYAEEKFEFDDLQRLQLKTDQLNFPTRHEYDDETQTYKQILPNGYQSLEVINSKGQLTQVTETAQSHEEKQQRETSHRYDRSGNLLQTTRPDGEQIYHFYDKRNRPVVEISPTGITKQFFYDVQNRTAQTIEYATALDLTKIPGIGTPILPSTPIILREIEEQRLADNPKNQTSYLIVDASGRDRYTIDAAGYIHETIYDELDRPIITIDYAQAITETELTNVITQLPLNRDIDLAQDRVSQTFYTDDGEVLAQQDPAGYVTHHLYDAAGRLRQTVQYATPSPIGVESSNDKKPQIEHDFEKIKPVPNPEQDIKSYIFYDALGQVTCKVDAEGYVDAFSYNPHGKIKQSTRFTNKVDPNWYLDTRQQPQLPNSCLEDKIIQYEYDEKLRETYQRHSSGLVKHTIYDEMDHVIQQTIFDNQNSVRKDPDHRRTTAKRYDGWEQITHEANAYVAQLLDEAEDDPQKQQEIWNNQAQRHFYDHTGLRLKSEQKLQLQFESESDLKTVYYYDSERRQRLQIDPQGAVIEKAYNAFDEVIISQKYTKGIDPSVHEQLLGGFVDQAIKDLLKNIEDLDQDIIEHFDYDRRNLLILHIDGESAEWSYDHNAFGEQVLALQPVADNQPDISITQSYEKRGLLIHTIQTAGQLTTTTSQRYDHPLGKITEKTDELGGQTVLTVDRLGRTTSKLLPEQTKPTQYHYDAWDRMIVKIDPYGHVSLHNYDQIKRQQIILYPEENTFAKKTYNIFGEKTAECDALNCEGHWQHTPDGQIKFQSDGLGRETQHTYNNIGLRLFTIDPEGREHHLIYNKSGHALEKIKDYYGLHLSTVSILDALGRRRQVTDPSGCRKENYFNKNNQIISSIVDPKTDNHDGLHLTTTTRYNARGSRTSILKSDLEKTTQYTVDFRQDELDRDISQIIDPQNERNQSGFNLETTHDLDLKGRVVSITDPKGFKTYKLYDGRDNKRFKIDAEGSVQEWTYDDLDQISSKRIYFNKIDLDEISETITLETLQDLLKPSPEDNIEYYFYDGNQRERFTLNTGLVTTHQHPVATIVESRYDLAGRKTSTIAYAQLLTDLENIENLTISELELISASLTSVDDRIDYWLYDAADQERFHIDPRGAVHEQRYDQKGRIITRCHYAIRVVNISELLALPLDEVAQSLMKSAEDRISQWFFNIFDKPEFSVNPVGSVQQFIYDSRGNLLENKKFGERIDPNQARPELLSALKDLVVNSKEIRIKKNEWDAANRKKATVDEAGFREDFIHDALGNLKIHIDRNGGIHTFDYDSAKRLKIESQPQAPICRVDKTTITLVLSGPVERSVQTTYEYDNNDNVEVVRKDANGDGERVINHSYDKLNRLLTSRVDGVEIDDPNKNASFDADPTEIIMLTTQTNYDVRGLTISEQKPNGLWEFTLYDSLGRKAYKINTAGGVTAYEYNSFNDEIQLTRYSNPVTIDEKESETFCKTGVPITWLQENLRPDSDHDRTTRSFRDKNGNIIEQRLSAIPVLNPHTNEYSFSEPITHQVFNAFNQCIEMRQPLYPGGIEKREYEWFDHKGRRIAQARSVQLSMNVDISYRIIRSTYNKFGEEIRRHEYASTLSENPDVWTIEQLDGALLGLTTPQDRIKEKEYDVRGLLKVKRTKAVIRQKAELITGPDGTPMTTMRDEAPQDLIEQFRYNPLEQKIAYVRADGRTEYNYYDINGQLIAEVGVLQTSLDEKENEIISAPITHYYLNAHGQRLGMREFYHGTQGLITEEQIPGVTLSDRDKVTLYGFDNRGCLRHTFDPENRLSSYTFTRSRKLARQWHPSEGSVKEGNTYRQVTYLDEKRHGYDAAEHMIRQAIYRDSKLVQVERQQFNRFGDTTAQAHEDNPTTWPQYNKFVGDSHLYNSNNNQGAPTLILTNLLGHETARIQSASRDLSTATIDDISQILDDRENIELTLNFRCPQGRLLEEVLPAHISYSATAIERIQVQMQVGNGQTEIFGAVNISWASVQVQIATPQFFLWRAGDDPSTAMEYPIKHHEGRSGVDVSDVQTDRYEYEIRYFFNNSQTKQQQQLYETRGMVEIITEHHEDSVAVIPEVLEPYWVFFKGNTQNLVAIDLYRSDNFIKTIPVNHAGDLYVIDLKDEGTGEYQIRPRFENDSVGALSLPFTVYTDISPTSPISRQFNPQATLKILDEYGELKLWESLPLDYQRYPLEVKIDYRDEKKPESHSLVLFPDTSEGEHTDDDGTVLSANIEFPTPVTEITALSVTLMRNDNYKIILYQEEQLPDDDESPSNQWQVIEHSSIKDDGEWFDVANTIKTYEFVQHNLILIEPVTRAEQKAGEVSFFDTSLDEQAHWRTLRALATTDNGLLFDLTQYAPGVYPYAFKGEPQDLTRHHFTLSQSGRVYASEPSGTLSPIVVNSSRQYQYDVWGNQTAVTNATGHTTEHTYNDADFVVKTVQPLVEAYDERGNVSSVRPEIHTGYDIFDQEVANVDGNSNTRIKIWDVNGRKIEEYLGDGTRLERNEYDTFNRVVRFRDPSNQLWRNRYDRVDNITNMTTPLGRQTNYTYSINNRRIKTEAPGGLNYHANHDPLDRVIERFEPLGHRTFTEYHPTGQPLRIAYDDGLVLTWELDYFGNVNQEKYLDGTIITHQYDHKKQRIQTTSIEAQPRQAYQLGTLVLPGLFSNVTLYVPVSFTVQGQDLRYEYSAGRLIKIDDVVHRKSVIYDYDNEYRRIYMQATLNDANLVRTMRLQLDALGREQFARDGKMVMYTGYDKAGNRVRLQGEYYPNDGTNARVTPQWNTFDRAGRVLIDGGVLFDQKDEIDIDNRQGLQLTYTNGLRKTEKRIEAAQTITQALDYDAESRLLTTQGSNATSSARIYDARGWIREYAETTPLFSTRRELTHNDNAWMTQELSFRNSTRVNTTDYSNFTVRGSARKQHTDLHQNGARFDLDTNYLFRRGDQIERVSGTTHNDAGDRTITPAIRFYDANNNPVAQTGVQSEDDPEATESVFFDTTPDGLILRKYYLRSGINEIGSGARVEEYFWNPENTYMGAYKTEQVPNGGALANSVSLGLHRITTPTGGQEVGLRPDWATVNNKSGVNRAPVQLSKLNSIFKRIGLVSSNGGGNRVVEQAPYSTGMRLVLSNRTQAVVDQPRPVTKADYAARNKGKSDGYDRSINLLSTYPPPTPIRYTVSEPQTFSEIATLLLGDNRYAGVIAQINGWSAERVCQPGEVIELPHNAFGLDTPQLDTPYEQIIANILGSLGPHLQWKEKKRGCLSMIVKVVISAATIVAVTIATGGQGTAPAIMAVQAFLAAAATNIALQSLAVATGLLDDFSITDLIASSITAGVGGYLKAGGEVFSLAFIGMQGEAMSVAIIYGAANILTQLTEISLGKRDKLDFRSVVSSMVGSMLGSNMSPEIKSLAEQPIKAELLASMINNSIISVAGSAIMGTPIDIEMFGLNLLQTTLNYAGQRGAEKINEHFRNTNNSTDISSTASETLTEGSPKICPVIEDVGYAEAIALGKGKNVGNKQPNNKDEHRANFNEDVNNLSQITASDRQMNNGAGSSLVPFKPNPEDAAAMDFDPGLFWREQPWYAKDNPRNGIQAGNGMNQMGMDSSTNPMYTLGPPDNNSQIDGNPNPTFGDYAETIGTGLGVGIVNNVLGAMNAILHPIDTAVGLGTIAFDVINLGTDIKYGIATKGSRERRAQYVADFAEGISSYQNADSIERLRMRSELAGGLIGGAGVGGFFAKASSRVVKSVAAARRVAGTGAGMLESGVSVGRSPFSLFGDRSVQGTAKGIQTLDHSIIKFSQSSVNGVEEIIASMKLKGWQGAPIDVARLSDGTLVTLDNTRLFAASSANIPVKARIRGANEPLSVELAERFTTKQGGVPRTWEEAVLNRINKQNRLYRDTYPTGSTVTGIPRP